MQVSHSENESNYLLTILAAFICVFYPLCDFGATYMMGWAFLLACWLFAALSKRGRLYFTRYRLGYAWIVFVVLIYFIMPNARNGVKTTQALIINMLICVLYIMSAQTDRNEILRVMKIFIIAGLVFSIYIIACQIFPGFYLNVMIPRQKGADVELVTRLFAEGYGASIGSSITYGSYIIGMASFFCLGDLFCGTKLLSKRKIILYELVFFVAVLCEGRRSELLGLIVSVLIVYFISSVNETGKVLKRIAVLIPVLLVVGVLVVILARHGYLERYINTGALLQKGLTTDNLNHLTSSRVYLWTGAWNLFKTSPILGIGWSSFSEHIVTTVDNVHNCYLQFLCETGIVGFVVIVCPMLFMLAGSISCLKLLLKSIKEKESLSGNTIIVSAGMQLFFIMLLAMDPVFYKSYYHMIYIILILFYEYSANYMQDSVEVG